MAKNLETISPKIDEEKVLSIAINSLFKDKTYALREVIQNSIGSHASEIKVFSGDIDTTSDELTERDLVILDDGYGMTREDIKEYLLYMGRGLNEIGKFGLGFFSTLGLVDEKIIIYTKKRDETGIEVILSKKRVGKDQYHCQAGISDLEEAECFITFV